MAWETLVAISAACLAIKASPGPGVIATVGRALAQGMGPTAVFILGVMAGDLLFVVAVLAGFSLVAAELGDAFFWVRLAAAAYLVYLGLACWLRPAAPLPLPQAPPRDAGRSFAGGVLLQLGNPKVMLFYLGLLPTFLDPDELTFAESALLVLLFLSILGGTLFAYAFASASARALLTSARAVRNLNRGAGTLLIGTGASVAAA
jgi:threonine/homoserine/homoserine lactone efflux protein